MQSGAIISEDVSPELVCLAGALQGTFCTVKTILALLTVAWGRKGPAAFPGTAFGVWEEMLLIHQVKGFKV